MAPPHLLFFIPSAHKLFLFFPCAGYCPDFITESVLLFRSVRSFLLAVSDIGAVFFFFFWSERLCQFQPSALLSLVNFFHLSSFFSFFEMRRRSPRPPWLFLDFLDPSRGLLSPPLNPSLLDLKPGRRLAEEYRLDKPSPFGRSEGQRYLFPT